MSNKEVAVGLRITGDSSEATKAVEDVVTAEQRAVAATEALDTAFKTLGVRPLKDVQAETERLQEALAKIRGSGIVGPDQERAIAAFNAKLAALRVEAGHIAPAANEARAGLSGLATEAQTAGAALGSAAKGAIAAVAGLAGFNGLVGITKDVVTTGAAFETLEARLFSLLGSSEAAKEALGQIKALAISTPFEVTALADSFIKLTAFGLQPSMGQMRALSDTAATLGGGTEVLTGVTLALGQAWAKGKLQGEEILQLAERGVPIWDVLAQATGKNTAELQKMSEAGELGRGTILKLLDALGEMNAGASEKLMATFNGAVSNAKDALAEFYDMVAKAGVLEFLTGQLQDLLAEFDRMKQSGELQAEAKRLADSFIAFGEGVKTAISAVESLSGVIKFGIEVWVAWRLAGMTLIPVLAGVGRQAAVTAAETTALAGASNAAAVGMGRLATAARLIKGLTLVGLVEGAVSLAAEFLRAKKAAEDGERATKKMLEPVPVNGPRDAIKAVVTETEAARFKLTEYQRSLAEIQSQGKTTGDALAEMVKKADFSSPKGISEMIGGMDSLKKGAQATGQEIQDAIAARLAKMTSGELKDFGLMAGSAFRQGKISAEQLADVLNGSTDAALKKLGVSAEVSAGGLTAKFREASGAVALVEADFVRLQQSGIDAGDVLRQAFSGAIKTASSQADLAALEAAIRKAGEAGRISQRDVEAFLDAVRRKADEATPGINSLAEAFRTLGMKSPGDVQRVAQAAQESFEKIKSGSGYSRAELATLAEAFRRYAEASIAANGGVASDAIKAQAGMYGLRIEVDAAGKAMLVASSHSTGAADGVQNIGNAAARSAEQVSGLSKKLSELEQYEQNKYSNPVNDGGFLNGGHQADRQVDVAAMLYRKGASVEEAKAAMAYYGELFAREQATTLTGDLGNSYHAASLTNAAANRSLDAALQYARNELRTGNKTDLGTSVNDLMAQHLAKIDYRTAADGAEAQRAAIKQAGNAAKEQPKTIRLEIGSGRNKATLTANSQSDVNGLLKTLEAAGMRAKR